MSGPTRIAVLDDVHHEATTTARGLMSAADKVKVAGLSAGIFVGSHAISGGDISANHYDFACGFTPTKFIVQYRNASGLVLDGIVTDVATISTTNVRIGLAGGGAPALIATNVVTVIAFA